MSDQVPSYYAIIPANVRYFQGIPMGSKLMYAEISSLCNKHGYCWAKDQYFADLYGISVRTIKRWMEILRKNELIFVDSIKPKMAWDRKIWISKEIKEKFTKGQKCPLEGTKMSPRQATLPYSLNTKDEYKEIYKEKIKKQKNKAKEENIERAERVFTTDSHHKSLLKKANQDEKLVQRWYERLSMWKVQKNAVSPNDYTSIKQWVIKDIFEYDKKNPKIDKEKLAKENKHIAKTISKDFIHLVSDGNFDIQSLYTEIRKGSYFEPIRIYYTENGFKEQLESALRKMNYM